MTHPLDVPDEPGERMRDLLDDTLVRYEAALIKERGERRIQERRKVLRARGEARWAAQQMLQESVERLREENERLRSKVHELTMLASAQMIAMEIGTINEKESK